MWIDSREDEIVLTDDLGQGHDMVATIDIPPGRGWDKNSVIVIEEDGTLVVRVETGPDLRWDLTKLFWRPA